MRNRVLLSIKASVPTQDEAQAAIVANKELLDGLYQEEQKTGCSSLFLFTLFILFNVGMYFLLKNVSPGYVVPKMLLGNILGFILFFIVFTIIFNIAMRKKNTEDKDVENMLEDVDLIQNIDGKQYIVLDDIGEILLKNSKLILREHDFTYGFAKHDWSDIRESTNTDEWLFVILDDKTLLPIRIGHLKEKRKMEIIGIFTDRIRKAKIVKKSDDKAIES